MAAMSTPSQTSILMADFLGAVRAIVDLSIIYGGSAGAGTGPPPADSRNRCFAG
jgi:hypothetical protein